MRRGVQVLRDHSSIYRTISCLASKQTDTSTGLIRISLHSYALGETRYMARARRTSSILRRPYHVPLVRLNVQAGRVDCRLHAVLLPRGGGRGGDETAILCQMGR